MNLTQWRKREKISQVQLAGALGVSQSTVARYEKGELIPPPRVVPLLRRLMGADFDANDFYPADSNAAE